MLRLKILFVIPYPLQTAASQRFRFEQYLDYLENEGIHCRVQSFLEEWAWRIFYKKGKYIQKSVALVYGFFKRFYLLAGIWRYDFVFIHRESAPVGPPIIEWIAVKVFKRKVVYDFDDSIWIPNSSEGNRFFEPLKTHSNVFRICKWCYKVSVGNNYLAEMVQPYNSNVVVNPTTIDTEKLHNRMKPTVNGKLTLGWTGSHSTNRYLKPMVEVVAALKKKIEIDFVVISDVPPNFGEELFHFVKWRKETEIQDLLRMDVGVMPLIEDKWTKGKCGFKALQYMSLGIPALVSPVGVNEEIVDDGLNGFICSSPDDWIDRILYLNENRERILEMGKAARKKIELNYSVRSNRSNFIHLFS